MKPRIAIVLSLLAIVLAGWTAWHFLHRRAAPESAAETAAHADAAPKHYHPRVEGIRNVLLISIDTCRADRLSCYGYPRPSTPNIDAVAHEGVLFRQALAPVPMTLPSHSSTFTGTYPPTHGVRTNDGYRLADSNVTLAKVLQSAGYQTAAFVGGFPLDARFGLNQGFQTYDGRFDKEGSTRDRKTAEKVTGQGLAWLDTHDKQPFFLFLHYYDAHAPYRPPPPFDKTFADDPYTGGIAYIDSWIGRVVDHLRARGLYDNTLIIIVGDHGESLGEHGEQTHAFYVYQSTLHVPLVIRAPGLGGGREVQQTVSLVDIMPTALTLLGLAQPERGEGTDLRDCLQGRPWQGPTPTVYFESLQPAAFDCCPLQGVVEGGWKYIRAPRSELYDLAHDPSEAENVAGKEVETTRRLRDRLEAMLTQMKTAAAPGGSSLLDREAARRLESLGYVSGPVLRPEFDPRSEDPKDFRPVAARLENANELSHSGRDAEAKEEYLRIAALRPDSVRIQMRLGDLAIKQKRPEEAIPRLSRALAILTAARKQAKPLPTAVENHEIAAIHTQMGIALLMQRKTEQADAEFRTALAIAPDSADLQYHLGYVSALRGQTSEAVAYYRKALEIYPQHVEAHFRLGTALAASDCFDEALAHFRQALEIEPDNAVAHLSFADALAGRGRVDEAIAQYQKALEIEPDYAEAHNNLGVALAAGRGQVDAAIAHFQKALEIKPDYAEAHNDLGLALASRGKFDEAIAHYEKALALKPDYAEAHNNFGLALANRGRLDAAIVHFQKALEIKPGYAPARQNLERAKSRR